MAVMNLSSSLISRWMFWARLSPRESIWRSRIRLKPMIEVSEAEKKKEIKVRVANRIIATGHENTGCMILSYLKLAA
jgi:hypothetical protein